MTNEITHHLSEDILAAYATGTLPEAFNLVVATHISLCDDCRAALQAYEATGGALLETGSEVAMSDGALAGCLSMIDGAETSRAPEPIRVRRPGAVFPVPLMEYVGGDLDAVRWRAVGGGIKQAMIPTAKGASVRLLSIPGGVAVPDHGHRGREMTLVLKGAFADESDRFGRGDVEVADEDLEHQPVAEPGETCICLAATDAPLRFNGFVPRLAQKWMGI